MSSWLARVRSALASYGMSVADLARLLGEDIPASMRRRFRGEAKFSAYEMLRISHILGIVPDVTGASVPTLQLSLASMPAEGTVVFDGTAYLSSVVGMAQMLESRRVAGRPATNYIATADVPFARLCAYPLLAALYLFLLEGGGVRTDETFSEVRMRENRPELFEGFDYLARLHGLEDNVEVWGPTPLYNLLFDLMRLREWSAISAEVADEAYDALTQLTADLRTDARAGVKPGGGRFEFYAHGRHGRGTDIVVDGGDFQLTLHMLRRPYFAVSREARTAAIFRRLIDERILGAQRVNAEPPYAYRSYAAGMSAAVESARGRMTGRR